MARFLAIESASGLLLIIATIVALVWANSPWATSYDDLLHAHIAFSAGPIHLDESLAHWINDGLMAIFFFVVGLEIKRELVTGELRDPRAALLPAVGALGGMVVPAGIFLLVTRGGAGSEGWGIPMATDIAFAVGIIALRGTKVPTQLKIFILTLAIVDDIGAIIVIALFYSSGIAFGWLGLAGASLLTAGLMQRAKVWYTPLYVIVGAVCWYATLESGVHATIAGVALGLMTPARPLQTDVHPTKVFEKVGVDELDGHSYRTVDLYVRECVPVAERLQTLLHPFTSFVIIPVFALANAGVVLSGEGIRAAATSTLTIGIVAGLVVGKSLGITGAVYAAVRAGLCSLPKGVTWPQVAAVSVIAGIGFTVALFISALAFSDPAFVDQAKMGVLGASLIAAVIGGGLLVVATQDQPNRRADDDEEGTGMFTQIARQLEPINETVMAAPDGEVAGASVGGSRA